MGHPLDDVRLKSALCDGCGYHLGGIPTKNGLLSCPECGHSVAFDFEPRRRAAARPDRVRSFFIGGVGLLFVGVFGVLSWSVLITVVAASAWVFVAIIMGKWRRRCFED